MTKVVNDLLQEFQAQDGIDALFKLYVLKVNVTHNGAVTPNGEAQCVHRVELDHEAGECLLHYADSQAPSKHLAINLQQLFKALTTDMGHYEVLAAQEKETDDATLRYDSPLIGFGDACEQQSFMVICHA